MSNQEQNNLIARFAGTRAEYKRLLASFQSGELETLLQLPIEDVRLVEARSQTAAEPAIARSPEIVPQILQRVYNSLESSWQTIESLLAPEPAQLAPGWRGSLSLPTQVLDTQKSRTSATPSEGFMRWINLDLPELEQKVILIVALMPGESPDEIDALIEVRPLREEECLPPDLQLMVIDYKGAVVLSARSDESDPRITFALTGNIGQPFEVKVLFNRFSYLQEFLI